MDLAPNEKLAEGFEGRLEIAAVPESNGHRTSRVINRDYCKRWALEYCRDHRMTSRRKFTRVSEQFLNMIEAATKAAIIHRIESHSSKGQTLK